MELIELGIIFFVTLVAGGYHFDNQQRIPEGLSRYHKIKLKNNNVLKVFLILRDKNQRIYFSRVAVVLQITAYILAVVDFVLAFISTDASFINICKTLNLCVLGGGEILIIAFGVFYRVKRRK